MTSDELKNLYTAEQIRELIKLASAMREKAYAPYSSYTVGASALMEDGSIYTGCNIENASYGGTICAERTAIFKAISEGKRILKCIAICGGRAGDQPDFAYPCGFCRQVMREFSNPVECLIIVGKSPDDFEYFTLEELLPKSFGPDFKLY